ncbi:MAG: nitrous oxide reductase accessory protein NosL [Bacteroidetes bacterium]|nr:nitrous oxide reductase accessory protein NosL [Bacteroidota bacterium]
MKYLLFVLFGIVTLSCSTEPEPLKYGTDVCHFCKMTLMDNKFGAELVTRKGRIYKFDDMRCFLNYYNSGNEATSDFQHALVIDYLNPGNFLNAYDAFYLKSSAIHSPMDGQVAAFQSKQHMMPLKKEWGAIYLAWGEVVTQYK